MRLPDVVGMVLCDKIDFSAHAGRASLVDVFHARRFPTFPSPVLSFTVYVALYDGEGEGTMQLVIERLETEEALLLHQEWLVLPGGQC